jgi:hypothetical protein
MQSLLATRSSVGRKAVSISLLSLDLWGIGRKNLPAFSGSHDFQCGHAFRAPAHFEFQRLASANRKPNNRLTRGSRGPVRARLGLGDCVSEHLGIGRV